MLLNKQKVFICHSSKDDILVKDIRTKLETKNIEVWDDSSLKLGDDFVRKIESNLSNSNFMLLLLSKEFLKSEFAKTEYQSARVREINTKRIRILPILIDIDYSEIPYLLSDKYAIKLSNTKMINEAEFNKILSPIIDSNLSRIMEKYENNFYDTISYIDKAIKNDKPSKIDVEIALNAIKDEKYYKYFISENDKENWFKLLYSLKYFDVTQMPLDANKIWEIYPFIVKISRNNQASVEVKEILLKIVNDHLCYLKSQSNYDKIHPFTWNYLIEIISNIDNGILDKFITYSKINIKKDWLDTILNHKFNKDMIGHEIINLLWPKFVEINNKKYLNDILLALLEVENREIIKDTNIIKSRGALDHPQLKISSYYIVSFAKKNLDKIVEVIEVDTLYKLCNQLKGIITGKENRRTLSAEVNSHYYEFRAVKNIDIYSFELVKSMLTGTELIERLIGSKESDNDVKLSIGSVEAKNPEEFYHQVTTKIQNWENKNEFEELLNEVELFKRKLLQLYQLFKEDYSTITFRSMTAEIDEEVVYYSAKELLISVIKTILLKMSEKRPDDTKVIVKEFINDKYYYPVFIRIAIYVISKNWESYRDIFMDLLEKQPNCFQNYNYEAELLLLISENKGKLTPAEKENINNLIRKGPDYNPDDEFKEEYKNNWINKWFGNNEEYFKEISESGKAFRMVDVSPFSKEEILTWDNETIVIRLNEFKEKNSWDSPNERGLANEFLSAVSRDPNKFLRSLTPFMNLRPFYLAELLQGLTNYVNKNTGTIEFESIITFLKGITGKIEAIIKQSISDQGEDYRPDHIWVLNMAFDLIASMCKKDKNIPKEHVALLFAITKEMIEKYTEFLESDDKKDVNSESSMFPEPKMEETRKDYVTDSFNTTYGRSLFALLDVSLSGRRNDIEVGWKPIHNELLKNNVVEAYTLFGKFIRNFAYLDTGYVDAIIKNIKSYGAEDEKLIAFVQGYLTSDGIFRELYDKTKPIISKIIPIGTQDEAYNMRLSNYLTIGYLRNYEELSDDSLFMKMIKTWNKSYILDIVKFMEIQLRYFKNNNAETKKDETDKITKRIIKYWEWSYENRNELEKNMPDEYENYFKYLGRFIICLEGLSEENKKWIDVSVPFMNGWEFADFIESLAEFDKKEDLKYISSVILFYIKNDYFKNNYFHQENIVEICKNIRKEGLNTEAESIRNAFGEKGFYNFKDC